MLHLQNLKVELASYGAIRPEAWTMIVSCITEVNLATGESYNRELGNICFIADGLLKEYDPRSRKKPVILNFLGQGQFIRTSKYNQGQYLKAYIPTTIFSIDFESLILLFQSYRELKKIYDSIIVSYEELSAFRQLLLEEKIVSHRILSFTKRHKSIISLLKKKDIANYLHIDYDYFIRVYNKLL